MFLPRFTLRSTLKWVTLCALFSLVLARALAGSYWAIALSFAVLSIVAILMVHAGSFVIVMALSKIFRKEQLSARTRQGGIQTNPDDRYLGGINATQRST